VTALAIVAAYLLGSIPFSFLVARWWGVPDVRRVGSGNVGATNVMRSAGKGPGLIAFVLDLLKGAGGALIGRALDPHGVLPALTATAAVLGHVFPVWLRFRGGKGVATGAGAFLPLVPAATGAGLVAFALALAATRYVSLASIAGAIVLASVVVAADVPRATQAAAVGLAALIVAKHHANLRRIAAGTENRLGRRRA
jgi:glycerol-3-phosphate acyltransferase PlsY